MLDRANPRRCEEGLECVFRERPIEYGAWEYRTIEHRVLKERGFQYRALQQRYFFLGFSPNFERFAELLGLVPFRGDT